MPQNVTKEGQSHYTRLTMMPHVGYGIFALKDIGWDGWLVKPERPTKLFRYEKGINVPGAQASSMLSEYTISEPPP